MKTLLRWWRYCWWWLDWRFYRLRRRLRRPLQHVRYYWAVLRSRPQCGRIRFITIPGERSPRLARCVRVWDDGAWADLVLDEEMWGRACWDSWRWQQWERWVRWWNASEKLEPTWEFENTSD